MLLTAARLASIAFFIALACLALQNGNTLLGYWDATLTAVVGSEMVGMHRWRP
jgi:hypothetical protein